MEEIDRRMVFYISRVKVAKRMEDPILLFHTATDNCSLITVDAVLLQPNNSVRTFL